MQLQTSNSMQGLQCLLHSQHMHHNISPKFLTFSQRYQIFTQCPYFFFLVVLCFVVQNFGRTYLCDVP
jgi:hypothetical protein